MTNQLVIRGARQHNLKNIDLELPKNRLIVFSGLSGSGKSSLAFDTIYAEGQRRYVESLSSYARQFLGVLDKPDVDAIDGLSPAISIDQKSTSHNPRSTVGTITEIYDYLRLLFARAGHPHCPNCQAEISALSPQQIVDQTVILLKTLSAGNIAKTVRIMILSPLIRDRKGEFSSLFDNLRSKGFTYARVDRKVISLDEDLLLIKTNKHTIEVVIDRITVEKKTLNNMETRRALYSRLSEAVEQSLMLSEGLCIISEIQDASFDFPKIPQVMTDHLFSENFSCPMCNISIPEIQPRMFSFNSPHGACPKCDGIGKLLRVDPDRVINKNLSISEGGILPFAKLILSDTWFGRIITNVAANIGITLDKPLKNATRDQLRKLLYGTGDEIHPITGENRYGRLVTIHESYSGIIPELEKRFSETESEFVRSEIGKYLKEEECPVCLGKRLKTEALSVTVDGKSIDAITAFSVKQAKNWSDKIPDILSSRENAIAKLILKEIAGRLSFLLSVGLDYLTLDRSASSLSGGEAQRIRLASQIGSGLTGVLYVLDEPSIGLHARDNQQLIATLKKLRDLGNTLIVVEHDREIMEQSDLIVDIGPGAGEHGGKIVVRGKVSEIKSNPSSLTGLYLSGRKEIKITKDGRNEEFFPGKKLILRDCRANNLKNINVEIPLHKLVCVTGVSGSGKSSLVVDTLHKYLARHFNPYFKEQVGAVTRIEGIDHVRRVILIDQSPIGRTPRSNPATYTGAFTYVRNLYALTPAARAKGFSPGRFSFNVKGGRCESCIGEGQMKIEMQFLPDVYVTCDVCQGTRFNKETLDVTFKEKNISQVLSMTVEESLSFFSNVPGLVTKLETLYNVGLSYICLGQPAPHLSGGEAQRVKLATELSKKGSRETVYILDEPTTGLHFADLEKLLGVLRALVDMGNTVIVIEHNFDVIKNSDWIIDLGPEGGDRGGELVAEGTPQDIVKVVHSYTGQYLRKVLS